ncbi:uncharacterized protein LOC100201308 isoform X1 [Hydra vulgaris]|uniref:uncharacterized protein LOC100201308 isoform X1 n=1 Tax=Hydra vulgaris TaxID=6087 RepID=UPI001F5E49C4|nr:nucleolar protein 9 [Hydra vulgaris]
MKSDKKGTTKEKKNVDKSDKKGPTKEKENNVDKNDKKGATKENVDKKQGRLSEDTINYFKRVEQVLLENAFEDNDNRETFIKNVSYQIENDGSQLARHTLTSKVFERIIPIMTNDQFKMVVNIFKDDIEKLCTDRFASHVVETLCWSNKDRLEDAEVQSTFYKLCKCIRKLTSTLIRDVYGSHVINTVVQICGGVVAPEVITRSRACRESNKKAAVNKRDLQGNKHQELSVFDVPKVLKKSFTYFFKAITEDDNFGELLCHRMASPVLQVLLLVTSKTNTEQLHILSQLIASRSQIFSLKIEDEERDKEEIQQSLPVVPTDEVGSHLLEAIVETANEEFLDKLATKCFNYIFVSLCIHPVANYIAQAFMRKVTKKDQTELIINKLIKYIEDILAAGHMGCVVKGAETISRLKMIEKQKLFIKSLSSALHIPMCESENSKSLVQLILSLITYDVYFKTDNLTTDKDSKTSEEKRKLVKSDINYHGACLLKQCLSFKKSKLIVSSFMSLSFEELICIACHPSGSFAFESFFQNVDIPIKKKNNMANTMLSTLDTLVCDKFGSRVFDSMRKFVDEETRKKLIDKLDRGSTYIKKNMYGRICLFNTGLMQPKVDPLIEAKEKKRKIIKEIFEVNQTAPTPKKRTKIDDRALKYQEQLKSLGISFGNETPTAVVKPAASPAEDNSLSFVIKAIEATAKKKLKNKK